MWIRSSLGLIFGVAIAACQAESPADSDLGVRADATLAQDATVLDAGRPADAAPERDAESPELPNTPDAEADAGEPADTGEAADSGEPAPFTLVSTAFTEGMMFPEDQACPDPDLQPQLSWSNPPSGTMSYVLVLIDDTIDYVHWVAYDIPASTTELLEGASDNGQLPAGTQEADAYCQQYCGPCPPRQHTYTFRVYALDVPTITFNHSNPIRDADLDQSFNANTLGVATLTGTYQR